MNARNALFLPLLLGAGLALTPVRAQDSPQKPPTSQQSANMFTGQLVDASCHMSSPQSKCDVTETSALFGIQTADGKFYALDSDGNSKVLTALKSAEKKIGPFTASVSGTATGDTLKVETIQIR